MNSDPKNQHSASPASSGQYSLSDLRTIATLGMLTALAYAVMAVCKIIPPIGGFLSFDLKDTVMAIGGFLFGPIAALCIAILVPFIEFFTVSDTGWYGLVMNIISTVLFVCPCVYLYRRKHKTSSAVTGLVVGTLCLTAGMILWNFIITPRYFGMPRSAVTDLMPMIITFNLIKGTCNSALIMLLYPPISTALRKARLVAPSRYMATGGQKPAFNYTPMAISAVVLISSILGVLALLGII